MLFGVVRAQDPTAEDQTIDTIRRLSSIGQPDQERIRQWVQQQVDRLAATKGTRPEPGPSGAEFKKFRQRFLDQFSNTNNTPEFRAAFAAQTSAVASTEFAKAELDPTVSWGLAHALLDMQRQPESFAGLSAGLKARAPIARYLAARGLVAQRAVIAADKERLAQTVQNLRTAAIAETDPTVLGRLYEALAFVEAPAAAFDAYLAIMDARIAQRRLAPAADGAEIAAYEFFRNPKVLAALDANQKAELVRRGAVLMRIDAERYRDPSLAPPKDAQTSDLAFTEREWLERSLDGAEEILAAVVGEGKGGKIRDAFNAGGYEQREAVVRETYKWVGNATTGDKGAANDAPWNVPVGAP